MSPHTSFVSALRGVAMGTTLLLVVPVAHAEPEPEAEADAPARMAPGLKLSLSVEPGLALALTAPQSQRTDAGFGQTLKLLFGVAPYLELGPTAALTTLPAGTAMPASETAWAFGGGARMMRARDAISFHGVSPWADSDLLYVRTGGLDRFGFATAVGVALPIDERRRFWIGPYARYFQILQGERSGFDSRDAKILQLGIGLQVGTGLEHKQARARVEAVEPAEVGVALPPVPADRDPADDKVVVKPDKLQLTERIAFAWDSALLSETARPVMDEVAQALNDNLNFRVQVDGHASSEGGEVHNQALSEERASAVVDYLVTRGVARNRLVSKGFSSSVPAEANTTAAGRVTNRRVEFAVDFIILDANAIVMPAQ